MYEANENVIEFLRDEKTASVTFSQPRFISKVRKLAAQYPNEVMILHQPEDNHGYLVAHLPVRFIKLNNPTGNLTEEERSERSERARNNFHTVISADETK